MKSLALFRSLLFFCISAVAWAQETIPALPSPALPPAAPVAPPTLADDGSRVAVLGYHDLGEAGAATQMRIHTSNFRKQMERIKQSGIKVISMAEFSAWKMGNSSLPAQSILLTFDDGWKSVYTDAYPVLKEFNFPFTIFLYKEYVDGGGKALTTPMIEEMCANGATLGSHSVSHPYPMTVKSYRKKGAFAYDAYLRKEMGVSKYFLESKFSATVTSYAYPGGYHTEEMHALGTEFGYHHLFTVIPGKITRSLPDVTLPRYIILGNFDKIFDQAISFQVGPAAGGGGSVEEAFATGLVETTPFPVTPVAGAIINSRLPLVSVDFATLPDLDPATLSMKISGFGEVPAKFVSETRVFSWLVNRKLRQPACLVEVAWKDLAGKAVDKPLRWSFQVDRDSAYLPETD